MSNGSYSPKIKEEAHTNKIAVVQMYFAENHSLIVPHEIELRVRVSGVDGNHISSLLSPSPTLKIVDFCHGFVGTLFRINKSYYLI
jgi:hypothetical protein